MADAKEYVIKSYINIGIKVRYKWFDKHLHIKYASHQWMGLKHTDCLKTLDPKIALKHFCFFRTDMHRNDDTTFMQGRGGTQMSNLKMHWTF